MHVTGPVLGRQGFMGAADASTHRAGRCGEDGEFLAGSGCRQFQSVYVHYRAELGAAIQAAHKRGAKVTGHLCSVNFREAADLGIDDLEHGFFVDTEFLRAKSRMCVRMSRKIPRGWRSSTRNSGPMHDTIAYLVAHHVAMTSTLPVFEMGSFQGRPTMQKTRTRCAVA